MSPDIESTLARNIAWAHPCHAVVKVSRRNASDPRKAYASHRAGLSPAARQTTGRIHVELFRQISYQSSIMMLPRAAQRKIILAGAIECRGILARVASASRVGNASKSTNIRINGSQNSWVLGTSR